MLWVKKGRNLSGGKYFLITVNIFPMPKILNDFFCSIAFVDKIIRGNVVYNLFYFISLWLILGNICLKRERSAKISHDQLHSSMVRALDLKTRGCGFDSLTITNRLSDEHIKEPGVALSSFVLYPCTIPCNKKPSSGGVTQMGNR